MNEWVSNVKEYGDYLGVRKEKIVGVRMVDDMYELYYKGSKDTEHMLYIEEHVYATFYEFLRKRGWKKIFLTKYLALPYYEPTFVLFAEMREYELRYHFTVNTRIILDVMLSKKQGEVLEIEEAPFFIQEEIRLTYQYMDEYLKSKYLLPLQLEKDFFHFIYEQDHIRYQKVTAWHIRETVWYLYLQFSEIKKGRSPKQNCIDIVNEMGQYDWDEKYDAVIWLALSQIMQTQSFMTFGERTETLLWVKEEYTKQKSLLTEKQKKEIEEEGVELL